MKKDILNINRIIKNRMENYLQEIGLELASANRKQKGKAFLEFYTKDILKYTLQLDEDLIDEGVRCDYKGDLNIDFVYQKEETYFIIQSKFKSSGALTSDEISGFLKIHSRITDKSYFMKHANGQVKDLLSGFSKKNNIHYLLITNSVINEKNLDQFEKEKKEELTRFGNYNIDCEIKGASEIKSDYKMAQSIDEPIPEEVLIPIESIEDHFMPGKKHAYVDLTTVLGDYTNYKTVLTTIKGSVLKQMY